MIFYEHFPLTIISNNLLQYTDRLKVSISKCITIIRFIYNKYVTSNAYIKVHKIVFNNSVTIIVYDLDLYRNKSFNIIYILLCQNRIIVCFKILPIDN